jgi:putative transcriptional regulator
VLTGSFSDSLGQYRAGDRVEMDDEVDHQPVVDRDGECICLAAVEGGTGSAVGSDASLSR